MWFAGPGLLLSAPQPHISPGRRPTWRSGPRYQRQAKMANKPTHNALKGRFWIKNSTPSQGEIRSRMTWIGVSNVFVYSWHRTPVLPPFYSPPTTPGLHGPGVLKPTGTKCPDEQKDDRLGKVACRCEHCLPARWMQKYMFVADDR